MSHEQYDVSEEMLRLFKIKQKQRQEAKAYYEKMTTNPHRPLNTGALFDPVMFRFNATAPYQVNHYRITPKNLWYFFSMTLAPIFITYNILKWEVTRRNDAIRAGVVPYKDRTFKLVY